jgi:predicted O-methyltransferase YrrM
LFGSFCRTGRYYTLIDLPDLDVDFASLNEIIRGPIRAKLLLTGIEMKLFNNLCQPCSAKELAQKMDFHPENTQHFLDGLATCNLVVKKKGLYQNTPVSQAYLVESSATYLGRMFQYSARIYGSGIESFPMLIKNGPPECSRRNEAEFEAMNAESTDVMENVQRAGFAQMAVELVSTLPEFPSLQRMLDLGGGPGLTGIAIVSSHPSMQGVIFDLPTVVSAAKKNVKEYAMTDRIKVLGGDFRHDGIGNRYDLVWASGTLNFAKEDINQIVEKIYASLNPNGVFVSFHEGATHDGTEPETMVLTQLAASMMGYDFGFDQGVIADAMFHAGFRSVRSRTLETPMGPVDLDVGRKSA